MITQNKYIYGLKWIAGGKFATQLFTWVVTIYVMRLVAPSDYGLLAMATIFIAFFVLIAEVGLGPALVQQGEVSEEEIRQGFGIVLIVNGLLFILTNIFAVAIATFFDDAALTNVLRVLSLKFFLISVTVIPDVLIQRELKFKHRSVIDLTASITGSLSTLVLAILGNGVWSLVIGSLIASVTKAISVNLVTQPFHSPKFSFQGMAKLIKFGKDVTVTRVLWFLYTQADTIVIGKFLGKEILGFYYVAMHLASLPVQRISSILNEVAFPTFARMHSGRNAILVHVEKSVEAICFFSFPIMWGISSIANEIVILFLGPNWKASIFPLATLSLLMPLRMIANFLPSATDALGHPDASRDNVLLAAIIMPTAFYIGCHWGLVGVTISWLIAYPVVFIFNLRRISNLLGMEPHALFKFIYPSAICGLVMYFAVWLTEKFIFPGVVSFTSLVTKSSVGALSYLFLSLWLNPNLFKLALAKLYTKQA